MDVAAFVVSAVAVLVAGAAAWYAKRSADAAARSATAAEDLTEIERGRDERALEEDAARAAPNLDAGEGWGAVWQLATDRSALNGQIRNNGPGVAQIEQILLDTRFGSEEATWDHGRAVMRPDEYLLVEVRWRALPDDQPMTLQVEFAAAASQTRHIASFLLHPDQGATGSPIWRSTGPTIRRA